MARMLVVVVGVTLSLLAAVRAVEGAATRADRCAAAKLKAASKKAAAKLRCHEKALVQGKRVASACLLAADDRFLVAFAKAELKGGCATTRDQAEVEDQVERFVDRKSTRLNSSHTVISYAVFCLKKKTRCAARTRPRHTSAAR